jgi:molybdopterin biosynthesis enzyme
MLGISEVFLPEMNGRLRQPFQTKAKAETVSFLFSRLIIGPEEAEVESLRSRSTGMFTEMLAANSLIKVEPGKKNLEKGERVRVQLLDLGLAGLSYFAGF